MSTINDNEMPFRAAAHELRRSIRKGKILPDMVDLAPIFANLFLAMAEEEHVGNPEGAIFLLREACEAFDDDEEDKQ